MGAGHMRLWLEALPAHMHAPLAPLAIFGKRAETTVVAVADWFVLWRHLVTVGRQLERDFPLPSHAQAWAAALEEVSFGMDLVAGHWLSEAVSNKIKLRQSS